MLSPRFKYIIGIGVGAGAYVLAKFAVSLPTPPNPRTGLSQGPPTGVLPVLPLLLPLLLLRLGKSFFHFSLQGNSL